MPKKPAPEYKFGGSYYQPESIDAADPWYKIKVAVRTAPKDKPWTKWLFKTHEDAGLAMQRLRTVAKQYGPKMSFRLTADILWIRLAEKEAPDDENRQPDSR